MKTILSPDLLSIMGGRILLTQRITWHRAWKYVFNGFDFDELYHLEEAPEEMNNLIDDLLTYKKLCVT